MAKYQYAKSSSGSQVSAIELAGTTINDKYHCIGCGNELIARVNGKKVSPHFAHKVTIECSEETYLHKLAKNTFFNTYNKCIEDGLPFFIELSQTKKCVKYKDLLSHTCSLEDVPKKFDLTRYFSEINIEKRDGEFIPDLLLKSKKNPELKIYIEIAVSHFLSEKKESSGERIIEIPIVNELDVKKIETCMLTESDARFIGFTSENKAITDDECICRKKKHFCFYVFKGGKAYLEYAPLYSIDNYRRRNKDKIIYCNIFDVKKYGFSEHENKMGNYFIEQLKIAKDRNVKVKSCFVCRYHGLNRDFLIDGGVFCKYLREHKAANFAASCSAFRYEL